MFSVPCVCVSVRLSVLKALSRNSIAGMQVLFIISRSSSYIKVIGSRSRSQKYNSASVCPDRGCFVFDWKTVLFLLYFYLLRWVIKSSRWLLLVRGIGPWWNALAPSVRSAQSLLQLRRDLKTSLFQLSYSTPQSRAVWHIVTVNSVRCLCNGLVRETSH